MTAEKPHWYSTFITLKPETLLNLLRAVQTTDSPEETESQVLQKQRELSIEQALKISLSQPQFKVEIIHQRNKRIEVVYPATAAALPVELNVVETVDVLKRARRFVFYPADQEMNPAYEKFITNLVKQVRVHLGTFPAQLDGLIRGAIIDSLPDVDGWIFRGKVTIDGVVMNRLDLYSLSHELSANHALTGRILYDELEAAAQAGQIQANQPQRLVHAVGRGLAGIPYMNGLIERDIVFDPLFIDQVFLLFRDASPELAKKLIIQTLVTKRNIGKHSAEIVATGILERFAQLPQSTPPQT